MALLGDIGSFAGGASQGAGQGMALVQQFMAMQEARRQQQARAALFNGQPGMGGPPPPGGMGGAPMPNMQPPQTGMPPPPGQASMPAQPPPGGPQGGQPQMQMQPPQGAMPGGPPPQGGQMQPPQGGPPQAPGGAPGGMPGGQGNDPFDPYQSVLRIAMDIKRRNPDIDPATLTDAVSQTVDLMKGIQPDLRAQMSYAASLMRDQASMANAGTRAGVEARGQDIRAGTTTRGQDIRADTAARGQDLNHEARMAAVQATVRDTDARIQDADRRTTFTQNQITQRFNAGLIPKGVAKAQRDVLGAANAQYRTAKDAYSAVLANVRAGVLQMDDPSVKAAADRANAAAQNLQGVTSKIARESAAAPPSAAPTGSVDAAIAGAPTDKASAGLQTVPAGLPDPKGHPDGTKAKDDKGAVVAVIRAGKWVKP